MPEGNTDSAIFIVIDGVHDFVSPISNHSVYLYQYVRNHREKSTATGSQLDAPHIYGLISFLLLLPLPTTTALLVLILLFHTPTPNTNHTYIYSELTLEWNK